MNKKKLIAKIRREFPQVKFRYAKLITKGWDHDVLVLDNKFIFRFAKEKLYKNSFAREVKFLRKFSRISNLRIPNYTFLSRDKTFGGYEMIKGRELTPKMYRELSVAKKKKFIRSLANFLSILHNIPLKKAKQYGFAKYKSWQQVLRDKQKWFKSEFERKVSKKLTVKQNAFIRKFVKSFYQSQYSIKPVLGHYDLSHDHIIMKKDGNISGIIDFGDVTISDPASEFNGFADYDPDSPRQIYKYYQGPKDPEFLERCRDHYIHRWIYLLYDGLVRRKNKSLWKEANQQINKLIRSN